MNNLFIFLTFFLNIYIKMLTLLNIHYYSHQVKTQFHRMNGMRVLTVSDSEKRCVC